MLGIRGWRRWAGEREEWEAPGGGGGGAEPRRGWGCSAVRGWMVDAVPSVPVLSTQSFPFKVSDLKICRYIILHVVLHGCETWFLTFRGERRLRVFDNGAEENI